MYLKRTAIKGFLLSIILLICSSVYSQPVLVADVSAIPSQVSTNQQVTLIMTITNTGDQDADSVIPYTPVVSGCAAPLSVPVPGSLTITAGNSSTFTWVFTACESGTTYISVSACSSVCSQPVGTTITVQIPASLTAGLSEMPVQVSTGQYLTVIMTVTNTGQAEAINVCPLGPTIAEGWGSTASVALLTNPTCQNIAGGAAAYFTWTYSAAASGTLAFLGNVQGNDANSGNLISTGLFESNGVTIQTPVNLEAQITAFPSDVVVGQMITVVITITNTGQANASGVVTFLPTVSGTGSANNNCPPSCPIGIELLDGNSSANLQWVYTAISAGEVCFSATARGIDVNSGVMVYSTYTQVCVDIGLATPTQTPTDTPTYTSTPTITNTAIGTPTITPTTCTSEGTASLNPGSIAAGSIGNTLIFTYTNGPVAWSGSPGYGTLIVEIPMFVWTLPSLTPTDPGYFTVSVNNGTLYGVSTSGNEIIIEVSGLAANTGTITVTYGDKSGGGPGVTAPSGQCPINFGYFFIFTSSPDSSGVCMPPPYPPGSPSILVYCNAPPIPTITTTNTAVNTFTETIIPTVFFTNTLTPTISTTNTLTMTQTPGLTFTQSASCTFTGTPAVSSTPTVSPTPTQNAALQPVVYPNPGHGTIKFANIMPGSKIEIYTISAELVIALSVQDAITKWNCINSYGSRVSPGIYYYLIRDINGIVRYSGKIFLTSK